MWHDDGLRRIFFQDRAPISDLGCRLFLHGGDGAGRGDYFRVREGGLNDVQAEIEIGIAVADINRGQALAAGFNALRHFLRFGARELGVN
ncbi:hypothetical protein D9M70_606230 [compost metagenome]